MADVRYTGVKTVPMKCTAIAPVEGYMYHDNGSGSMELCHINTEDCHGVAAYSSIDCQTGAAKTLTAGDSFPFYLIGSGAIVGVASEAITWQFGDIVTLGATVVHMAMAAGSGHTRIGHYIGVDNTAVSAGDIITVVLDIPMDTTT